MGGPTPLIAIRGKSGSWVHLWLDAGRPDNAMLKMRLGDTVGPHIRFEWLDGRHPVTLQKGQKLSFGYRLWMRDWEAMHIESGEARQPRPSRQGYPVLRSRGTRYELTNGSYQLAATRFGGGRLVDFRQLGDETALISGSNIYTDGGIYPETTTPTMERVSPNISTSSDAEAEVRLEAVQGLKLTFSGLLRDQDGRGVPSPRTQYRVTYSMDQSGTLGVQAAVRCQKAIPEAKAFLAQTLSLPSFVSYEVNAKDGVIQGTAEPGAGRVWESIKQGFGDEPWMVCRTGDGRSLRVAGPDLATRLQNAFLYRTGQDGVVFLSWNDFQPADIQPVWRELSYTLTPEEEAQ